MESNKLIESKVKVFCLVQVEEIIRGNGMRLFKFDDSKTAICLGVIIDDLAIALAQNRIYPIFNYSDETQLNTYYLYETYDYGVKIPNKNGFITFEEDSKVLREQYHKTVEWYYNEVLKNEEKKIINFEKEKAIRYRKNIDI